MRALPVLLGLGLVAVMHPVCAGAGTASLLYDADLEEHALRYRAAAGEANRVTVSFASGGFTVTDAGATVSPGAGCEAVTPNEVRCGRGTRRAEFLLFRVVAGDRDDVVAEPTCACPRVFEWSAYLSGGDGDDSLRDSQQDEESFGYVTLHGGRGSDSLRSGFGVRIFGGPGDDRLVGGGSLYGGPGADTFRGRRGFGHVNYSGSRPISVDTDGVADDGRRGEHDNVMRSIHAIGGGGGSDRLVGNGRDNELWGGGGDDVVTGGKGHDLLHGDGGDDVLRGQRGKDNLDGFEGNDLLVGGPSADTFDVPDTDLGSSYAADGRDRLLGGAGNDQFEARDGWRDIVRGGRGTDRARLDRRRDFWRGIEGLNGSRLTG